MKRRNQIRAGFGFGMFVAGALLFTPGTAQSGPITFNAVYWTMTVAVGAGDSTLKEVQNHNWTIQDPPPVLIGSGQAVSIDAANPSNLGSQWAFAGFSAAPDYAGAASRGLALDISPEEDWFFVHNQVNLYSAPFTGAWHYAFVMQFGLTESLRNDFVGWDAASVGFELFDLTAGIPIVYDTIFDSGTTDHVGSGHAGLWNGEFYGGQWDLDPTHRYEIGLNLVSSLAGSNGAGSDAVLNQVTANGAVLTSDAIVPEPASLVLFGTGLVGLVGAARRRLRK